MTTDAALTKISLAMEALEPKFVKSGNLGFHLPVEEVAEFKRLTIEAKALLDHELGRLNDFSTNLLWTINQSSGGFVGGPSLAAVKGARAVVEGGINHIRRKPTLAVAHVTKDQPTYVSPSRLAEVRTLSSASWDVTRLVRLMEELNIAHAHRCYMSVAMLVRAITDHAPPRFQLPKLYGNCQQLSGRKILSGFDAAFGRGVEKYCRRASPCSNSTIGNLAERSASRLSC